MQLTLSDETIASAGTQPKFAVVRVHDGVAVVLEMTFDSETKVITFESDQFSTYALAYPQPVPPTSNQTSQSSSNSSQHPVASTGTTASASSAGLPNTADEACDALLLLAIAMGIFAAGVRRTARE